MSAVASTRSDGDVGLSTVGVTLALDRVCKGFGPQNVLKTINLQVRAGQFLAIVGRSGSGKSTLLRLLCGLDQPSSGTIRYDGEPISPGVARLMFQEPRLLPWARVIDNVKIGLDKTLSKDKAQARTSAALRAVGLETRSDVWPTILSGGQKQRVALARALVSRPSLLLLDEPLGALDALTRIEMQDLVARAWEDHGFTAVLVTHDVSEAVRLADRILLLEDGAVTLDVENQAPRPRMARSPHAAELESHVLERLMRR